MAVKAKDIVIGGLALVGAGYLLKTGADYAAAVFKENISYIQGRPFVNFDDIGAGFINIVVPATILNMNPLNIHIDYFFADVYYGTVWLGEVSIQETFDLNQNEAVTINIRFSVHIPNTIVGVFNAASQGGFSAILKPIYLKGYLAVFGDSFFGQVNIPIETEISLI